MRGCEYNPTLQWFKRDERCIARCPWVQYPPNMVKPNLINATEDSSRIYMEADVARETCWVAVNRRN